MGFDNFEGFCQKKPNKNKIKLFIELRQKRQIRNIKKTKGSCWIWTLDQHTGEPFGRCYPQDRLKYIHTSSCNFRTLNMSNRNHIVSPKISIRLLCIWMALGESWIFPKVIFCGGTLKFINNHKTIKSATRNTEATTLGRHMLVIQGTTDRQKTWK